MTLFPNARNSDSKQKCQGTLVHHTSSFISKVLMAIGAPWHFRSNMINYSNHVCRLTTDSQKYQKLTAGRHDAADFAICIWNLTSQHLIQINYCGPCLQSGGPSTAIAGLQPLDPWLICPRWNAIGTHLPCGSMQEAVSVAASSRHISDIYI